LLPRRSTVNIDDICAAMINRGGYNGSKEDAVRTIRHFILEMQYQFADGFSVNLDAFSVHPAIGGTFDSENEDYDRSKHPVSFHFQSLKPLRMLRDSIEVIIEGKADVNGYIAEFIDTETNPVNETAVAGNQFVINGHKVRLDGDDPDVGVYFVPVNGPSKAVKASRLAENTASRIIGITPQLPDYPVRIEIRTQYSSGSFTLKAPRIIISGFVLNG